MKPLKIYQVDAFVEGPFSGNPAAVCPLTEWLDDDTMQNIALENNLSETAFYVKKEDDFELRWFTPTIEVDLCGHATLAASYVIFEEEGHPDEMINFTSLRSGKLSVSKNGDLLTLNFPVDNLQEVTISDNVLYGLNIEPIQAFRGNSDVVLVYNDESEIKSLMPDFTLLGKINARGVIVTAPGSREDFVSRFFGPNAGVNEDPVTGSAYTELVPYWAERTGQHNFRARQMSKRGGELQLELRGDRVMIAGQAVKYLLGMIEV